MSILCQPLHRFIFLFICALPKTKKTKKTFKNTAKKETRNRLTNRLKIQEALIKIKQLPKFCDTLIPDPDLGLSCTRAPIPALVELPPPTPLPPPPRSFPLRRPLPPLSPPPPLSVGGGGARLRDEGEASVASGRVGAGRRGL